MAGEILDQFASAYAPMTGVEAPRFVSGFETMPFGIGDNPMLGVLAQPFLSSFMAKSGMAPMGINQVNVADILEGRFQQAQRFAALQQSTGQDRQNWVATMRGVAAMTGTPWGADQIRAANNIAGFAAGAEPILAQLAPDLVDSLNGRRGSSVVMAQQLGLMGRYRIDPVTGRTGQTAATIAANTSATYDSLFGRLADPGASQGLSAGTFGQIASELQMRGMIGSSQGPRETLAAMANDPGLTALAAKNGVKDLRSLSSSDLETLLKDEGVDSKLRSFDADKFKNKVRDYAKVVGAMRDIFGDNGRPDAPVGELLRAMEAMTNGSSGQLTSGQISMLVRTTQQLASSTGVGIDRAMLMQADASQRAAQLGLSPLMAVQATQGALAFGGAYRAAGGAAGSSWGRMTADQLMQMDSGLRVNAAASTSANQMAAVLRIADEMNINPDSELGSYAKALRGAAASGDRTWSYGGQTRDIAMGQDDFLALMRRSGFTDNEATQLRDSRAENQEYTFKYRIGDVVRREQGKRDFTPWVGRNLQGQLQLALKNNGQSGDDAQRIAAAVSDQIAQSMIDLGPEGASKERTADGKDTVFHRNLTDIIQREVGKAGGKIDRDFASKQATLFAGTLDERIRANPSYRYLQNIQNGIVMFNDSTVRRADSLRDEQDSEVRVREALSPLTRNGGLRQVVDYLQSAGDKGSGDLMQMVLAGFGGVDQSVIDDKIKPSLGKIQESYKALGDLRSRLATTADPKLREELRKQLDTQIESLHAQAVGLDNLRVQNGMGDDPLTGEHIDRALNQSSGLNAMLGELGRSGTKVDSAFWASEAGQSLAHRVDTAGSAAEDVAARMANSKDAINRYGKEGVDQAAAIQAANRDLTGMAFQYSGGRMERLMAGDLDGVPEADKAAIMARVKARMSERDTAIKYFDDRREGDQAQWDPGRVSHDTGIAYGTVALAKDLHGAERYALEELARQQEKMDDRQKNGGMTEELRKSYGDAAARVRELAGKRGVGYDDMVAAGKVFGAIDETTAVQRHELFRTNEDAAKKLYGQFGVSAGDAPGDQTAMQQLTQLLGSGRGQQLAAYLGDQADADVAMGKSQGGLKGSNQEVLGKMYAEFADREGFKNKYGQKTADDFAFREKLHLNGVGDGTSLADGFATGLKSGEMDTAKQTVKVDFPDTMQVRGSLDLKNGQLEAQNASAPSRNSVPNNGGK